MTKDYIPVRDKDFNDWFKFLNQYVAQKSGGSTPAWTHIPQAARTALADAYIVWYTACANSTAPPGGGAPWKQRHPWCREKRA